MNYPDYDSLREDFEAGNITAVDFVLEQSEEVASDYEQFCNDNQLDFTQEESAKHFMEYREELFEESVSL